jgi:hypothetical protein
MLINILENDLNRIIIKNQQSEIKLSQLNSLSNVVEQTKDKLYLPISSSVNLN